MKIAVNTRLLLKNRMDGIGWFTCETMKRIVKRHPEHEFHFLFDRTPDPEFLFASNVIPHVVYPPARHSMLMKIWYNYAVPRVLKKTGADIFISPDSQCSLRTSVPQLVVLHDINFEHYPDDIPGHYSRYLRHYTPLFAGKAARIATVSEFSKEDLVKTYRLSPDKIDVVYNGVNESYGPVSEAVKTETRNNYAAGQDYFVFVGSIHPRKNLQRLLPAFDQFKADTGSPCKLVIVGHKFWYNQEIESAYERMSFKGDVIFTGRLEPEDLRRVVGSALASVYVSYFEGFGIPLLEAFQCGVPVVTSNITSMPEVAGDAALLVDPFSVEDITRGLKEIYSSEPLRSHFIRRGFERVKSFSWDRTSGLLWASIEKVFSALR